MLTLQDKKRVQELNTKHNYSITNMDLKKLVDKHKKASLSGNTHIMELVEYRLTDLNWHREVRELAKGNYEFLYGIVEDEEKQFLSSIVKQYEQAVFQNNETMMSKVEDFLKKNKYLAILKALKLKDIAQARNEIQNIKFCG